VTRFENETDVWRDARRPSRSWVANGALARASALVALILGVGCGGEDRLEVSQVRGRVVYKGRGVPRATVIFFPQGATVDEVGTMRPFAYADDEGNFELKTYVDGDGAPPGDYRVSIIASSTTAPGQLTKDRSGGAAAPAPGIQIPATVTRKFANVDSAGIQVQVKEGENNLDPFELSAAGGAGGAAATN
jgi:hypothetical protein